MSVAQVVLVAASGSASTDADGSGIGPGLLGFLVFAGLCAALIVLYRQPAPPVAADRLRCRGPVRRGAHATRRHDRRRPGHVTMPNRLRDSTSPYLLQHADNPVDWWEWGDDAFAEARRRDVPVLLSRRLRRVPLVPCHGARVVRGRGDRCRPQREIRRVKVDREERPDVDAVYMEAVQALTGQGGWPMTVFLTPDGRAVLRRHVLPAPAARMACRRSGRCSTRSPQAWIDRRGRGRRCRCRHRPPARRCARPARGGTAVAGAAGRGRPAPCQRVRRRARRVRRRHRSSRRRWCSSSCSATTPGPAIPRSLAMVEATCEQMARGGMYDQLGGGFARYSVDRGVGRAALREDALRQRAAAAGLPALVAGERVAAGRAGGARDRRLPAPRPADRRRRVSPRALDADTVLEGRSAEGATYVWTPGQLREVLGDDDGAWAAGAAGCHGGGHLRARRVDAAAAGAIPTTREVALEARQPLHAARARRPQPARDDKVVAAWNGLAIAALAEAGTLLDRSRRGSRRPSRCADLLVRVHLDDARPARPHLARRRRQAGTRASSRTTPTLPRGFSRSYRRTGDPVWLAFAGRLLDVVLVRYDAAGRRLLRHCRRRDRPAPGRDPATPGPDRQRDTVGSIRRRRSPAGLRRPHRRERTPRSRRTCPRRLRHPGHASAAVRGLGARRSRGRSPPARLRSPSSGPATTRGRGPCTWPRCATRRRAPPSWRAIRRMRRRCQCRCWSGVRWSTAGRRPTCAADSSVNAPSPTLPA